jgi:hypothetical protein
MADFSIASQIKPVQLPDQLQQYAQFNQMQAANMLMQQRARELQKENALAAAGAKFGVNTPEFARAAGDLDYEAGLKAYDYQSRIVKQQREAAGELRRTRLADIQSDEKLMDLASKHGEEFKNGVRMIEGFPEQERPAAWGRLISALPEKMRAVFPSAYSPDAARLAMSTTSEILSAAKPKESQYLMGPAGPIAIDKNAGTYSVVPEGGAAPAAVAAPAAAVPVVAGAAPTTANAQPFAAPTNTPAAVMRQPTAVGVPPAVGDAYSRNLDAAEGRDKNSRSTAQGFGQFLNGTFVDTAKKVFPELASKSPAEILTLRGTKLADGTPIEAALEQKFRTDNIASLASAGIQPTPGNVYLAHFLGAGGARNVLSADPNTPLSQVVSADAIKANPEVLAIKNKTVGDLQNWANSKFGNEPGLAASMTASNARMGNALAGFVPAGGAPMSLDAPTANNALMASMMAGQAAPTNMLATPAPPQLAAPAAMPAATAPAAMPAATAPAPTTLAGQRKQIAEEKLAEKGAEERQKIQINKEASDAEKVVIRGEFDKVWTNIISQFKKLGGNQMLIVPGETSLGNRAKAIGSTLSPTLTTLVAPERAAPVTTLSNVNQTMLSALMGASGLTAQQLNSNKEMSAYLASLSNPGQPVDSIVDTLNNLSERFGTGQKITVKDLTGGKAQNPQADTASARQRSGGAAPAAVVPPPAAAGAIPPEAIARLKANPSTTVDFDEIFGPGAAAKVLGR